MAESNAMHIRLRNDFQSWLRKYESGELDAEAKPTPETRCGNCDHISCLHSKNGCSVRVQRLHEDVTVACACEWNEDQASDIPSADSKAKGVIPVHSHEEKS